MNLGATDKSGPPTSSRLRRLPKRQRGIPYQSRSHQTHRGRWQPSSLLFWDKISLPHRRSGFTPR